MISGVYAAQVWVACAAALNLQMKFAARGRAPQP